MQTPLKSSVCQIFVYLEIPGLNMAGKSSVPLLAMLTESLRRALELDALILASIPPLEFLEMASATSAFLQQCRTTNLLIDSKLEPLKKADSPDFHAITRLESALAFFEESARLCTSLMLASREDSFAGKNLFYVGFGVRDGGQAVGIVTNELQRLGLLQFAEIADGASMRVLAGNNNQTCFARRLASVRQCQIEQIQQGIEQLKQGFGMAKVLREEFVL